jgi:TalC/MipB family fructose-6-phosphate aldolase
MGLYVDSACLEDVARVCASYPIAGVTTNPSILLAAWERGQRLDDVQLLRQLLHVCEGPVFAQPSGADDEALHAATLRYLELAPNRIVPKLPMTPAGLRVGLEIRRQGGRFAFTAVSTLGQAYCAVCAGAAWVIPYVGRLRRAGHDPCERVGQMARLLAQQDGGTRILAASIKSATDLDEAVLSGAHDVTADPGVIEGLLADPLTEASIRQFDADWERLRQQMAEQLRS